MMTADPSPFVTVFQDLQMLEPKWRIELGDPGEADGWIRGVDFADAANGPFNALLRRIGDRFKTNDRKTIAASFGLRYGWAASIAIAPYLTHASVPYVGLDNISLKFREDTLFERTALHDARGAMLATDPASAHPSVEVIEHPGALLRRLRHELYAQAQPVVSALQAWSGFAPRGSWGMITSSWAAQFIAVCDRLHGQTHALPIVEQFFDGDDDVAKMQPRLHPVTFAGVTHLYQRRASCCRYYLLPDKPLCASCPLVSHDERIKRNLEWMERQLTRA